jgi:Mg/Co/Ni transporter MgtE
MRRLALALDGILWPQAWPWPLRAFLTGAVLGTAVAVTVALVAAWVLIGVAVTS